MTIISNYIIVNLNYVFIYSDKKSRILESLLIFHDEHFENGIIIIFYIVLKAVLSEKNTHTEG